MQSSMATLRVTKGGSLPGGLINALLKTRRPCAGCSIPMRLCRRSVTRDQVLSFRKPSTGPFLPPQPIFFQSRRPHKTKVNAAAAAPVPPPCDGVASNFNKWLAQPHSTELSRFLEARGIRIPDLLFWLPPSVHARIHAAEDELAILAQELLLAFLVLVVLRKLKNMLQYLHHAWYFKFRKKEKDAYMEHKRNTFEHTVFGALKAPLSAATILLWTSHLYTVIAPIINVQIAARTVAVYREVSIIGVLVWFALNWKNNIIGELQARSSEQSSKAQLGALDKLATIAIISFGIMVTGEVAGYAFKSILALGGVSGIAIGLAARDVVGNMFGGTMLYLTRPFSLGDSIKAGNLTGQVVDIGFYSTKLLSPEKQPTYVPNAYFTNQVITNFSRATNRVLNGVFTLRHQDLVKVEHIVEQVRNFLSAHAAIDIQSALNVNLINVTPYNLEIQVNVVTKPGLGGNEFNRARQEIYLGVVSIIEQAGARLSAFPDQPYPPLKTS